MATPARFPDWVQINFNGQKTIDHVVVYTLQDNYANPVEPTDTMTFSLYGITAFQVQGWNGTAWVTLGSVSGNNLVKRTVSFAPYTTDRIRIHVTGSRRQAMVPHHRDRGVDDGTAQRHRRPTSRSPSNGGVASASSTIRPGVSCRRTSIDNQRSGAGLGTGGGGWNDATPGAFPDWVQINFNGQKTIDHVVVYSVQDNYLNPVEPTDTMTFTLLGITDFTVQGWNGTNWVTLATVSRQQSGQAHASRSRHYATDRIRIYVTGALAPVVPHHRDRGVGKLAHRGRIRLRPSVVRVVVPNHRCIRSSKKPTRRSGFVALRVPDDDLLSHGQSVLSSARRRFTVLFGMGRGGASGLWSSGIDGWQRDGVSRPHRKKQ